MKDNALGVRKKPEKTWSQVSQAMTTGLCGKHEPQEEIPRVRTVPYRQKAKSGQMEYGGLLQVTTFT